jgi:hypothetical protein
MISCQSTGFDYGEITYFKTYNVNWRRGYTTRHIEIDPYFGIVRWGSDESYPQPILFYKWNDIDLLASTITAEEAIKIANINGGEIARLKEENNCYINLRTPASFRSNNDNWSIDIISNQLIFKVYIDPYTGRIENQE